MVATRWRRSVLVTLGVALAHVPVPAQAQCTKLNGGCGEFPQQCFADTLAPFDWTDGVTSQTRGLLDSLESSCHPPVTIGPPACCSFIHPPGGSQPTIKLRLAGNRIFVDYDAPDYLCQQTGDWPPGFTCTNSPLFGQSDHLVLWLGTPFDLAPLAQGFIYYENGTWDTGVDVPCNGARSVTAEIDYLTNGGVATASTKETTLFGPPGVCTDRLQCPAGPGVGSAAARPINVGSGDVALRLPLFRLAQSPLALGFELSYHSEQPRYPGLVSSPLGLGWTHTFAQTLRPADAFRARLYQISAEGFEYEYAVQGDGSWLATSPGELRGRVVEAAGRYLLTDLDGTITAFDVASGAWLATTDRWGNSLQGGYDGAGNLVSVTDSEGRQVVLSYAGGLLAAVTLPDGSAWRFGYAGGELASVFDPLHAGAVAWRSFSYQADSQQVVRLLAAARDEAGFLLEGHAYDFMDRGVSSVSEGGNDRVSFEYDTPARGQTRVTHAIDGATSQVAVFTVKYGKGRYLPLEIDGDCESCMGATSDTQSFTYYPDNHVASRTDGLGHLSTFAYNPDGNLITMSEAMGTPQARTTTYHFDYAPWPNFRTAIFEPSAAKAGAQKVTTFGWNASGAPETVLTTAESGFLLAGDAAPTTYTTTRTFDARHRLLATTGPRTDVAQVVTETYYGDADADPNRRGRLQSVTDPSGNVTTFDNYDEFGTALTAVDPNGVVTARQTDARGRVIASTSRAVPGVAGEASDYTTAFTFDGRDRLVRTVLPRGNGMAYGYEDGTDRLIDTIRLDAAGNQVERHHLTLNAIGDKVTEEDQGCATPAPACAAWATRRSESFAYDLHNRLAGVLHPVPAGSRTFDTYDPDGQLSAVEDEDHASPNTFYSYDALHRMTAVRQTLASAPGGAATTSYAFDVMDDLAAVTDPNGNTTSYRYDDFRRLQRQDSPVTGATTYQYDPGGNLVTMTDARGAVTTRTYDPANRVLTSASQLAGAATEAVTYAYDSATPGSFGKGRLSRMADPSGATAYAYERRGLLNSESRTVLGSSYATAYQFDANGNRSGMTYPSGRQVAYGFDFADRPFSAASGGTTYVASATYLPFGPEAQLVLGNGTTQTRSYDLRYRQLENRLDGSSSPLADYLYSEDAAGNVTAIHDGLDATFDRDFAYDDLYRLTGAATGDALWGPGSYGYDAMGNMTSLALGASRNAAFSYSGTLPQLTSVVENGVSRAIGYDPAGNEVTVGSGAFTYSSRNLLAAGDGLAYTYDGRGVRVAVAVTAALGTITGTVVDQTGQPIAGAAVRITGTANATTSDGAGNFNLTAPAGLYTLTVSKSGYLPATTTPFTLAAGATFSAGAIPLRPAPGKITGTVLGSPGNAPLAGATVSLAENGDTAFADASGSFTLAEPAGTYTVTVAQAGYASQTLQPFALAAGTIHPLGAITLVANPATLSGHVVSSAGGAPIAGATVIATAGATQGGPSAPLDLPGQAPRDRRAPRAQPAAASFTTTTDAAGNFALQVPPGTYGVTVTAAGFGSRTTAAVSVGPGAAFGFGTLALDALGTITGTVVQAAGSLPIQGATVTVLGTLNATTTDAHGAFTLTQAAGSFSLQVAAPGFAPIATAQFTLAPGATVAVGAIALGRSALSVYVGYADTLRPSGVFPVPWQGSPNTVFLGRGPVFDAGAVRLDNASDAPLAVDSVVVDLGRPGPVWNLWGSFVVPARGAAILTQDRLFGFDTSDFPLVDCGQPLAFGDPRVPRVTVTIGGTATTWFDHGHILDTGGFDLLCQGNESLSWRLIDTTGITSNGAFTLAPATGSSPLATPYSLTATVTDANGQPQPGVSVTFTATSGPNRGLTGQAITNASGAAVFSYQSATSGADLWQASIPNPSGGAATSNLAAVRWLALGGLEVKVGYADTVRPNPGFPVPFEGDPGTISPHGGPGAGPPWDAGTIRLDNTGANPLVVDKVLVDLQRPGPVFDLWGSFTIPPHQSAILTQTVFVNFDTSDYPFMPCHQPAPASDPRIPKVTVKVGGLTSIYLDTAHILDHFGWDTFYSCNGGSENESLQWRPIGVPSAQQAGQLALFPATAAAPVGAIYTASAVALDAGNEPLVGVTVDFSVLAGPDAGKTGQARTDASGLASFSFAGAAPGTDTLQATLPNQSGAATVSNQVTVLWLPQVTLSLSPATASIPIGSPYNATLQALDASGQAVPNLSVTFQVTTGPNAGKTAQQTTDAHGQAIFTYTGLQTGTDSLVASVPLQGGSVLASNPASVAWTTQLRFTLAPLALTQPVGTVATFTASLFDASGQPVAGTQVTFTVTSGPDAGTTGRATTNAAGAALFQLTGASPGADLLSATLGQGASALTSNSASVVWTAIATTVTYTGPAFGDYGDAMTLSARLTAAATGQPLAGQTLAFALGTQTLTGVTDPTGTATVSLTPAVTPGAVPLSIAFAGAVGYGGSAASVLLAIHRDDTALVYTGQKAVANGQPQLVSAVLTDPQSRAPLAGKTVTFAFGAVSAAATTDAAGTAAATLTLPASAPTGPALLQVTFAGDATALPATTTVPVVVYQPASFVVWGGNTPGLALGQRVNFWGSQWASQVTGGDYQANPSFKGYATPAATPVTICEPTARTSGSPQLDAACWASKPGNSSPPATLAPYIGVIVSTSIAKGGSTIYGNIAAMVVVQVDPSSPYAPDPGHPGYGTVAAVIADGAALFPPGASIGPRPPASDQASHQARPATAGSLVSLQDGATTSAVPATRHPVAPAAVAAGNRRFFFYTQELHLQAESELTTGATPAILTEYIWFDGHPVAQTDATGATSWTFTDHLGTPLLQTSAAQGVTWRAEYEPYGAVYNLRSPDQHQPLRLPGQEAEQLSLGANGVTSRSYNIHRWYLSAIGRYTSADPLSLAPSTGHSVPHLGGEIYSYVDANPLSSFDALGLLVEVRCERIGSHPDQRVFASLYHHCFVRTKCPCLQFDKTVEIYGAPEGKRPPLHIENFDGARGSNTDILTNPMGSVNCEKEQCVLNKASQLVPDHYHRDGPNSNSFAHKLVRACGMDAFPLGTDSAPIGWNDQWVYR
jgi:RHS repeat-associated protein